MHRRKRSFQREPAQGAKRLNARAERSDRKGVRRSSLVRWAGSLRAAQSGASGRTSSARRLHGTDVLPTRGDRSPYTRGTASLHEGNGFPTRSNPPTLKLRRTRRVSLRGCDCLIGGRDGHGEDATVRVPPAAAVAGLISTGFCNCLPLNESNA